jgi:hypothetical protein
MRAWLGVSLQRPRERRLTVTSRMRLLVVVRVKRWGVTSSLLGTREGGAEVLTESGARTKTSDFIQARAANTRYIEGRHDCPASTQTCVFEPYQSLQPF